MSQNKLRVCMVFGGKSAEHEVSIRSARSVFQALDRARYTVESIGIARSGRWYYQEGSPILAQDTGSRKEEVPETGEPVLVRGEKGIAQFVSSGRGGVVCEADVVFPVLHGPYGEDGTIQGLLKLSEIPFIGCGVLASSVCMDKEITKRLLLQAGVPTPRFRTLRPTHTVTYEELSAELGSILFVKPANMGSSVGISRVTDRAGFQKAAALAFEYDDKAIVEEAISGREIEISVLGNEAPIVSLPGEITTSAAHGFYSYDAKYMDDNGAKLQIPVALEPPLLKQVQQMAMKAYAALNCEGMARIDFFLRKGAGGRDEFLVNELNTIPGFTSISMYPKMWVASGISYGELLDRLIALARERHAREQARNCRVW